MIKKTPEAVDDPAGGEWHLDKRVPVALIVTLLLQAAIGLAWLVKLDARVGYLETAMIRSQDDHERLIRIDARIATIAAAAVPQPADDENRGHR